METHPAPKVAAKDHREAQNAVCSCAIVGQGQQVVYKTLEGFS